MKHRFGKFIPLAPTTRISKGYSNDLFSLPVLYLCRIVPNDLHITFVDLFLEILDLIKMLFQAHSLLLDHRHLAIVSQVALAGEFCISDLPDELLIPFLQSFEEEGFFEVLGFVFELELFWLDGCFFLFGVPVFAFEFIVPYFHASG